MKTFHASSLRKYRFSNKGSCYAITKCVEGRQSLLIKAAEGEDRDGAAADIVVDAFRWSHETGRIECLGYVVMPDHYHIVFLLFGDRTLPKVMESVSKFTARRINKLLGRSGRFWQAPYYERNVRDEDELYRQLAYVDRNPVTARLVESSEDWPWGAIYPEW